MLKANPRGGAGAPYLPTQLNGALKLVLVGPFHADLQTLKHVGICILIGNACDVPVSFKLDARFRDKCNRIV